MRVWIVVAVVLSGSLGACDADDEPRGEAAPSWVAAAPLPASGGAAVLRDGTWCGDRWVVVGAVRDGDDTVPAAWSSRDGTTWAAVGIHAHSYYGRRAILQSVACVGDRPVAVGERSGGAHGNRRVTTFRADGTSWTDVAAPFEQYGGPNALDVGPVSAGPASWLIVGNRLSGPAVWVAHSPRRFALVEGAPELADRPGELAIATQGAWSGGAWHVVGGESVGTERVPRAWSSADGRHWRRDQVPKGSALDDMERVVATDDGPLAVGRASDGFAVWRRVGGSWTRLGSFGTASAEGGLPDVVDLDIEGGTILAVVSDGAVHQLWRSADGTSWRQEALPAQVPPSGDTAVATATSARSVLLLTDDGTSATVWVPAP